MCIRDRPYVAEKMGVTASTILRYENGSIDNTKKMVLEGLSEALHAVSYTHLILSCTGRYIFLFFNGQNNCQGWMAI